MSVYDRPIADTPIAILDFETTGLSPLDGARVVEVAIVRIEPGQEPELLLDTLVDPMGPVLCTSIHGITDDDVVGAPIFADLADEIARALDGAVLGAWNASFDLQFLQAEMGMFGRGKAFPELPHICLMYLRNRIGLARCSLESACGMHGIAPGDHSAAVDALAAAHIWRQYLPIMNSAGASVFSDLTTLGKPLKFMKSWGRGMLSPEEIARLGASKDSPALKPRDRDGQFPPRTATVPKTTPSVPPSARPAQPNGTRGGSYWDALVAAFGDEEISGGELTFLVDELRRARLQPEEVAAIHAEFLGQRLVSYGRDRLLSHIEQAKITKLMSVLEQLGWAPKPERRKRFWLV